MTNHEYLLSILNSQDLDSTIIAMLQRLRDAIERVLRAQYGSAPRIYYGGSYGKNTMIKEAFDLDIIVYFPHSEKATLRDIYTSVRTTLETNKFIVRPKNVALRLPYDGG